MRGLAAAALLGTASAASADILVIRSLGPSAKSFAPGKRLPEGMKLPLKAGDQLVVLDGRGTRTLRGPGTFTAGAPAPAPTQTAMNAPATQRRARVGAVRNAGGDLRTPSIWHVDIDKSSTICVADPTKVTLWRADPARPLALTIIRVSDGVSRRVDWRAASSTLAWPAALPVADGAQFRLSAPGAAAPTLLSFRLLPRKFSGLEDVAAALISNDCSAQLELLIDTVRLPDDGAPAG